MLENLILGLTVTLIGLLMVFFILTLLILAINLLHLIVSPKKKKVKNEKTAVEKPVVAESPALSAVEEENIDNGVIAAISAAVYMMTGGKSAGHPEFVIRKIKRIRR